MSNSKSKCNVEETCREVIDHRILVHLDKDTANVVLLVKREDVELFIKGLEAISNTSQQAKEYIEDLKLLLEVTDA